MLNEKSHSKNNAVTIHHTIWRRIICTWLKKMKINYKENLKADYLSIKEKKLRKLFFKPSQLRRADS